MGKILDLPTPGRDERLSYLVLSDVHSLHCDSKAVNKVLSFFELVPINQRRIILLGDILDVPFIYFKSEEYKDRIGSRDWDYFLDQIEKEKVWYDDFYDKLRKLVLKDEYIYFSEGNHEQRLRRPMFISKVPYSLRHNFDLWTVIEAEKRGTPYILYNDYFRVKVGKESPLYFTHGMYCGLNPIRKHYFKGIGAKGSIIFGHTHEAGVQSFETLEQTQYGYNNPCLCGIKGDAAPEYLEGRSHNWSQGATIVNVNRNYFYVNILVIKNGELILPTGESL